MQDLGRTPGPQFNIKVYGTGKNIYELGFVGHGAVCRRTFRILKIKGVQVSCRISRNILYVPLQVQRSCLIKRIRKVGY